MADNVSRGAESSVHSLVDVAHGVSGAVLGAALVAGAVVTNALASSEVGPKGQRCASTLGTTNATQPVGGTAGSSNDVGCKTAENDQGKDVTSTAGLDVAAANTPEAATGTSDGSSCATGSTKQNEDLRVEEARGNLDSDRGQQHVQDEDVVDTGML